MDIHDQGPNLWAFLREGVDAGVYPSAKIAAAVMADALAVAALELGLSKDQVLDGVSSRLNARGVAL